MLPFCDWGCGIFSTLDLHSPDEHVFLFDPNPVDDDWRAAWFNEQRTLAEWLDAWLAGHDLWMSPRLAPVEDVFERHR